MTGGGIEAGRLTSVRLEGSRLTLSLDQSITWRRVTCVGIGTD